MMWRFKKLGGIPILITVTVLSLITSLYVGDQGFDKFNNERFVVIASIILLFVLLNFFLDLIESLFKVKQFVNQETGHVNMVALWRETFTNPLAGVIVVCIMAIGVANAQDLSELYRTSTTHWHDAELWQMEAACFTLLKGSFIDYPVFWDGIYFSLWSYLIMAYAFLYKTDKFHYAGMLSISTVVSFFLTRWAALQYATAGPVFYQPEFFNIAGTLSSKTQSMLVLYMQGEIKQNGFIPGTMGMPSLHIALTFIATWLLTCSARWTLWLSVPFCALTWLSTIMLGWHYILDGVGGIVVAAVSMAFAHGLLKVMPGECFFLKKEQAML